MNLDRAKQLFFEESSDLLEDMESLLLQAKAGALSTETTHAVFRDVHTIKGSAGLFGFDTLVGFAHWVETFLDHLREQDGMLELEAIDILLQCKDHLGDLVELAAEDREPGPETVQLEHALRARLQRLSEGFPPAGPEPVYSVMADELDPLSEQTVESIELQRVETDYWHISIRFGRDVLRNGLDPLSFIRYLGTLGQIKGLATVFDTLPMAAEMDAESGYLGFEISFESSADKCQIESVFEFVRDDCRLSILPPKSKIDEYVALIRGASADCERLGEILVACGSLTANELENALRLQAQRPSDAPRLGDILIEEGRVHPPVLEAALAQQKKQQDSQNREMRVIRVEAEKLDRLINLVGELVIAGAGAAVLAERSKQRDLLEHTALISRLIEEVRDSTLQLRMVEIGATFNRFKRLVHDVGHELGKTIELVISGAETELDKALTEKIADPLTHLVRNAIDHGIESETLRSTRGKPAHGTVWLNAFHDSGAIVIQVRDDGCGLDRERIRSKAIEKGLLTEGQNVSDDEIFGLIFEPGFSTAERVSNLSGRGVGMDVVKRNINALRGTIQLESRDGVGTCFTIRLPLTLAIIDGFLVKVGTATYVIPLDAVKECVELGEQERPQTRDCHYLNLRGGLLPCIRLRRYFHESDSHRPRRESVVVVHYAGQTVGLVVDELLGEFQTVIKPLSRIFANLKGISGSTILGSGEVALILDIAALIQGMTSERETRYAGSGTEKRLAAVRQS